MSNSFLEVVGQNIHLLLEETGVPGDPQISDKSPPNITYYNIRIKYIWPTASTIELTINMKHVL